MLWKSGSSRFKSKLVNAVEIEQAISALAEQPFDAQEFPFSFLQAFGNKETTVKRLRSGASNRSDLGGVLQTNNIHIAVSPHGAVTKTLAALKTSPATAKAKAKFILATDGADFEAEDLESGETVACAYKDFPDHFGFFLPLAGITTVQTTSCSVKPVTTRTGSIPTPRPAWPHADGSARTRGRKRWPGPQAPSITHPPRRSGQA